MSRIRLLHKTVIVAALVIGLLFASASRPAPAAADTETTIIIASAALVGYLAIVAGITLIIYGRRSKEQPQQPRRDPYSFTSDQSWSPASSGGLQFGSKCAAHGPGTLFCW